MRKNILFIADDFSEGGAARVVYELILGLDKSKYRPELCCLDAVGSLGEKLRAEGIEVHWLKRRPGTDWGLTGRIAGLVRTRNIHLMHLHQYTAFFYGSMGALYSGLKKVVFTEHGRHYPDRRNPKRIMFNKIFCPRTSRIIAVSEAVKQSLIEYEGIPGSRIEIIMNGIAPAPFRQELDEKRRQALRQELGIPSQDIILGMIARLGTEKNHPALMKAFQRALQQNPNLSLLIIGNGPLRDDLLLLRDKLGVGQKIIFTGVRQDVTRLLNLINIVVLSSFYEGTSITLLEAMAAGKPVLASRIGGNPQVVEDGITGWLFGGEEDLAQRILQLAADPLLLVRMGQAGCQRFDKYFTRQRMVGYYEQIYQQVLNA